MESMNSLLYQGLDFYLVTTWVNKPQNEGEKCIEPFNSFTMFVMGSDSIAGSWIGQNYNPVSALIFVNTSEKIVN